EVPLPGLVRRGRPPRAVEAHEQVALETEERLRRELQVSLEIELALLARRGIGLLAVAERRARLRVALDAGLSGARGAGVGIVAENGETGLASEPQREAGVGR